MPTDITWTNTTVKLGDLQPWQRNPRKSSKKQAAKMLESWDKFGQVQTVAVGPGLEVYDGHQRLSALLTVHGKGYEVDARQASRELSEEEREQLVVTLHTGAVGSWDWGELANWDSSSLQEWGFDADALSQWNTDAAALSLLLESEKAEAVEDPGADIDRAEELREKYGVELGQMWKCGEHRIICGDCTDPAVVERVMGGEKAGAVVTDPPYGIGADKKAAHSSIRDNPAWADVAWDEKPNSEHIKTIAVFADRVAIWGGNYFTDNLPVSSGWLAWVKPQYGTGFSLSDMELCWTNQEIGPRCKEFGRRDGHDHPTQKPVDLIAWTIEKIDGKGVESIVDFYSGSGTTLIACEQLSRKCRAVEISPAYVAVSLERFFQMTGIEPELIENG